MFKNKEKFFEKTPVSEYLKSLNSLAFEGRMLVPLVALDDGYAQFNQAVLVLTKPSEGEIKAEIVEDVMPSLAKRGQHLHGVIGGTVNLYGTVDTTEEFTVHPHVSEPEDTRREDYPVSSLNLCLTHAALDRLGLAGEVCAVATGLPLEEFMDGENGTNSKLINKKVKNLKRPVYITNSDNPSAQIAFAGVYPEAIAGMVDYLIDEFGNYREGIDPSLTRLAIDIGGNTTDLAIIHAGNVVGAKQTLKQGVKHVKDRLKQLLRKKFDHEPDDALLEQALKTKEISWFGGKSIGVAQEVDDAVNHVMGPVAKQIETFKGQFPSLREIVGFGGGVALMSESIKQQNPNIIIVENPSGANARGFLKCSIIYNLDEIMDVVKTYLEEQKANATPVVAE